MATDVLRRLIVSPEVTWGTYVTPATLIMGATRITPRVMQDLKQSEELGSLAPSDLVALVRESGGFGVGMDLSYEDILWCLSAIDTPGTTGSNPYTHTFAIPSTTAGAFTVYSMLMEWGDIGTEYAAEGCLATGFTISGDVGGDGVWQIEQDWIAEKVYNTSSTSTPSRRNVNLIRMADTTLAVDASNGTMGSTVKTSTLISFTYTLGTSRHLKHFAGSLFPLNYGVGKLSGQLSLVCELNTDALAIVNAMFGTTVEKQIRLLASSSPREARLDFAGYLAAPPLELDRNRDGNSTVELVFNAAYNSTYGNFAGMRVINALATWPP